MWRSLLDSLPRGYSLEEADWQRRHRLLLGLLAAHVPALAAFGFFTSHTPLVVAYAVLPQVACATLGHLLRAHRRTAAVLVTAGLVYSSTALVGLSGGAIEAHFHFFIIVGFIALYQDWAPFLFNILFTIISHGVGSFWQQDLIFAHPAGQENPWGWSVIHGVGVLATCAGMMLFWRVTEESQREKDGMARRLAESEIVRRQFTSDLLVNLARRNQSMLYRQLDIINQLEESERDPDALAELFKLDHLATRVRRNAENLLVLSGEQPQRTWSEPIPLRDVVRAAIAETEDMDRVVFVVDEQPAVIGRPVTDLTHLLAELTENAVRFSPPDTAVTVRARPNRRDPGGHVVTVEDWGVGMPPEEFAAANTLLAEPSDVDLSVSQRLGFHVVSRLAQRHGIEVTLTATPGSGITAVVVLPSVLFEQRADGPAERRPLEPANGGGLSRPAATLNGAASATATIARPQEDVRVPTQQWSDTRAAPFGMDGSWNGWWRPDTDGSAEPDPGRVRRRPSPTPALPPSIPAQPTPPAPTVPSRPRMPAPHMPTPHMPTSAPRPGPSAGPQPTAPDSTAPTGGLRRRVPQSHLAPELREPAPASVADSEPAPGISAAAGALSRYQAHREAARNITEEEGTWRP